MESNGIEGSITVSETTKELLELVSPNSFVFEEHKEVLLSSFNEKVKSYKIADIQNE